MDLKKIKEAEDYLNKALKLSNEIGSNEWIKESYSRLEELDSIQGNWKAAYDHHKLFIRYRDRIDKEELETESMQRLINNDFEKNEAALRTEEEKKNITEDANKKRKQLVLILGSCILILIFALARFIYRSKTNKTHKV
ncbi:MAG: hypothetical protein K8R85_01365 [Bacteroidetes bacterium]|nr:hypothetical protein [Bacteroidota bacterium]